MREKATGASGRPRKGDPQLNVERIVQAAWALVDREGVDALSTRTLAAELNVKGPALYWHMKSMQELLGLMMEHALRDSIVMPSAGLPWPQWLREVTVAQRRVLLAHRDSGRIASYSLPSERTRTEIVPRIIEPLIRAGFRREDATAAAGALASFVLGWVIYEQGPETRSFVASLVDLDSSFEYGLSAFIQGLVSQAPAKAREGLDE